MRELKFVTVDVFTTVRFGGNPVAVVFDADGVSTQEMQQIAAEFNLAESTFVLSPEDRSHDARVRIFTPKAEMPFAGHPNVGTAFALAMREGGEQERTLNFEEQAGLVTIQVLFGPGGPRGAELAAPQRLSVEEEIPAELVAAACGLGPEAIRSASHPPCITTTGTRFVTAEVVSVTVLNTATYVLEAFHRHFPMARTTGIHLYAHSETGGCDIEARMFAPLFGVPEDPATGSAATNLIGLLASLESEPDTVVEKSILQGTQVGRPSLLETKATKTGGEVIETRVGGNCVSVMAGTLRLD